MSANFYELCVAGTPFCLAGATPLHDRDGNPKEPRYLKEIHTHLHYEVFVVTCGRLTVSTATETQSFSRAVCIVPPRFAHHSVFHGESGYALSDFFGKEGVGAFDLFSSLPRGGVTAIPLSSQAETLFLTAVAAQNRRQDAWATDTARAALTLFFIALRESLPSTSIALPKQDDAVTERAQRLTEMEKFLSSPTDVKLGDVAKEMHLSKKQVSRIIHKEYGRAFSAMKNEQRLRVAQTLLKNSDLPIHEIARQAGFENENYFFRLFKMQFGLTPLKYRAKHR